MHSVFVSQSHNGWCWGNCGSLILEKLYPFVEMWLWSIEDRRLRWSCLLYIQDVDVVDSCSYMFGRLLTFRSCCCIAAVFGNNICFCEAATVVAVASVAMFFWYCTILWWLSCARRCMAATVVIDAPLLVKFRVLQVIWWFCCMMFYVPLFLPSLFIGLFIHCCHCYPSCCDFCLLSFRPLSPVWSLSLHCCNNQATHSKTDSSDDWS